jgi:drug/metabolite transporter (DMT)-like permease
MTAQHHHLPWRGLAHLIIVYLVWGSTYLAMRVTATGGFPPLQMAASRVCIAAAILMIIVKLAGLRIRLNRREAAILAASGILLWLGGNGMVAVAEKHVASGFAALIIGSTPVWPAIFEAVIDRRRPTWRLIAALLTGFLGLVALIWPLLQRDVHADLLSALLLVFATLCWSAGSVLQQRCRVDVPPLASSAWQHTFGAAALLLVALFSGEPAPQPTHAAWFAWGFLIIFGSLISFTSYVIVVRILPMPVVMTYAYVNPVTAVILGRIFLREPITRPMLLGMALIITGVAGIFYERFGPGRRRAAIAQAARTR